MEDNGGEAFIRTLDLTRVPEVFLGFSYFFPPSHFGCRIVLFAFSWFLNPSKSQLLACSWNRLRCRLSPLRKAKSLAPFLGR